MIDRKLWKRAFSKYDIPVWVYPTCDKGKLRLDTKTLSFGETRESAGNRKHEEWEPDWIEGRYSCLFRCDICDEVIASAGSYGIDYIYLNEDDPEITEKFRVEFFSKSPDIFRLPVSLPDTIGKEIRKAFQLYWTDEAASANRVRSGIELLLTHLDVKRFTLDRRRKRVALTLHARIELLKARKPDLAERLLAMKWLGNAGSHPSAIRREDILDAFDILEDVLDEVFQNRQQHITRIVKQVNKAKGPRNSHRK